MCHVIASPPPKLSCFPPVVTLLLLWQLQESTYQFSITKCAQSLHSCPTLWNPMDCSPPGSFVHGIHQARTWSGLPCPPQGDLPDPGIESVSPELQADSLPLSHWGSPSITLVLSLRVPYEQNHTVWNFLRLASSTQNCLLRVKVLCLIDSVVPFSWVIFHCVDVLHFI